MAAKKPGKAVKCFTYADLVAALKQSIDHAIEQIALAKERGKRITQRVIDWLRDVSHPEAPEVLAKIGGIAAA